MTIDTRYCPTSEVNSQLSTRSRILACALEVHAGIAAMTMILRMMFIRSCHRGIASGHVRIMQKDGFPFISILAATITNETGETNPYEKRPV